MTLGESRRLRVGGHHDSPHYATVVEHCVRPDGTDADRGVLFATVVGPDADARAREIVAVVNAAREEAELNTARVLPPWSPRRTTSTADPVYRPARYGPHLGL